MFIINDYIIYGAHGVCKIIDIEKNNENNHDYFIIEGIYSNILIKTPVKNKVFMRKVLNEKDATILIESLPEIDTIWINDAKERYKKYNKLLSNGLCKDLMKVIKTLYLRKGNPKCKSITATDKVILEQAKVKVENEFAIALKIPNEEVEDYIFKVLDEVN